MFEVTSGQKTVRDSRKAHTIPARKPLFCMGVSSGRGVNRSFSTPPFTTDMFYTINEYTIWNKSFNKLLIYQYTAQVQNLAPCIDT